MSDLTDKLLDQYHRLIPENLPKPVYNELIHIAEQTNTFQDEEACEIYAPNIQQIIDLVTEKHPTALKGKRKLVQKTVVKKVLVAKPVEKKRLVKK